MTVFSSAEVNSSDIPTQNETNARPFSAWSKLRRENPREYYKPKTQERMMKDASLLGDSFLDDQPKEWYK